MLQRPRCIRIFNSRVEAENARKVLVRGGFECYLKEDRFVKLRLPDLGMLPRCRLYVEQEEIPKVGEYLARKLQKSKKYS